jgi:hypothetical protein
VADPIGDTEDAELGEIAVVENENEMPPVSIMPLVPMAAKRFVKADVILLIAPLFFQRVFW